MRNLVRTAAAATGAATLAGVLVASVASANSAGHPAGELPSTHGTTTITTTPVNALHTEGGIGNTMVYNGVMPTVLARPKRHCSTRGFCFITHRGSPASSASLSRWSPASSARTRSWAPSGTPAESCSPTGTASWR